MRNVVLHPFVLPLIASLAMWAASADAEPWQSVFASTSDTTFFLFEDGTVVRAPFHLGTRDTLWTCPRNQHVVRFAASPRGDRVAWISRDAGDDTTRLWLASRDEADQRLRYFPLIPQKHGHTFSEPDLPTIADESPRGGRLLEGGARTMDRRSNTLAWTSDGRQVVVGYDGGLAWVDADQRAHSTLAGLRPIKMESLPPPATLLVDALLNEPSEDRRVTQQDLDHAPYTQLSVEDGRVTGPLKRTSSTLMRANGEWRICDAQDWARAKIHAATRNALWWADGSTIRGLDPEDCSAMEVSPSRESVSWLDADSAGVLIGVSGGDLWVRWPDGNIETQASIGAKPRMVLRVTNGSEIGLVLKDSLLLWEPSTGEVKRHLARQLEPCALFEGPGERIVARVDCGSGRSPALARLDHACACLRDVETPRERWGVIRAAAGGAWILLYDPGRKPPKKLRAYDVAGNRWFEVDNPGIAAWEAPGP